VAELGRLLLGPALHGDVERLGLDARQEHQVLVLRRGRLVALVLPDRPAAAAPGREQRHRRHRRRAHPRAPGRTAPLRDRSARPLAHRAPPHPRSRDRRRTWSNHTAATSTALIATGCQNCWTPTMTKPFVSTAGMKTPITVPNTEPTPPNRLVPPSTTAAIAFRLSVECPLIVVVPK